MFFSDDYVQDAWDSYIQNTGLDSANHTWATNIDFPIPTPVMEGQEPSLQPQQQANLFSSNSGVFMGVNTPPRNVPM